MTISQNITIFTVCYIVGYIQFWIGHYFGKKMKTKLISLNHKKPYLKFKKGDILIFDDEKDKTIVVFEKSDSETDFTGFMLYSTNKRNNECFHLKTSGSWDKKKFKKLNGSVTIEFSNLIP